MSDDVPPDEDGLVAAMAEASVPELDPAVAAALATAAGWVGDAVTLVGVGRSEDGSPCIVVHATRPPQLPAEVEGVPVEVVLDTDVHADGDDDDDSP